MRRQLVLMAVAITSIVVLAFVIPLAVLMRTTAADRAINRVNTAAQSFSTVIENAYLPDTDTFDIPTLTASVASLKNTVGMDGVEVTLALPDGTLVGATNRPIADDTLALARLGRAFNRSAPGGVDAVQSVVLNSTSDTQSMTVVVRAFVPNSELRRGVAQAWLILGLLGLVMILLAALVGDRIARSITRPLLDASQAANRLAGGDLLAHVEPEGTNEVRAVAHALNLLAERIGELLQAERESIADLSHRLRTPMTSLRLSGERISDPAERRLINSELDRLEEALNAMITQARAPISHDLGADLSSAVQDRMAFWTVLGAAQMRPVSVELKAQSVPVNASRHDLDSIIDAVVGNVFHHTPAGNSCRVTVDRSREGGQLIVDDTGPGLPGSDMTTRGRRGERSRGTGLGLSIVRKVAEQSGGRVELGPSPMGGARVVVTLGGATSKLS